jgi:hypothetical protein
MKIRDAALLALAVIMTAQLAMAGEVKFANKPVARKANGKTAIAFAVSAGADVEVAILDAKGKVVRHLAAGVLGGKAAPPAPLKPGLSQSLVWDGKDDYGSPPPFALHPPPFSVRVRAGMGVKMDRIVGGDPYTYFSKEVGRDNHAGWRFGGLEVKSDGSVYLIGNVNNFGPAAVRRYDAEGNYMHTVYPPPAGKPIEQMKGWGINQREDGSYIFRHNNLDSSSLSTTGISGSRAWLASMIPSARKDRLLFLEHRSRIIAINTDGSIPAAPKALGLLVNEPSIVDKNRRWRWQVAGNPFVAPSPDGKHFYLSGVFGEDGASYRRAKKVLASGFWRDGQVYKVDAKTRKAEVFFALDEKSVVIDLKARGTSPIGDGGNNVYAALHGVAVDAQNNVFICDRLNKRIVIVNRGGKQIREIPVDNPDAIALVPGSKALFVTTRRGRYHKRGPLHLLKFSDWSKDSRPAVSLLIARTGVYKGRSYLGVTKAKGKTLVWLAYVGLPVRIYQDMGASLKLAKDFYEAGRQRAVDVHHMVVDQRTEDVYVHDGFGHLFRISDWSKPRLKKCKIKKRTLPGKRPLSDIFDLGLGFAIDARSGYFYLRGPMRPVNRYKMRGEEFIPAPIGQTGSSIVTAAFANDWRINLGMGERGMAVSPDGGIAVLASTKRNDYSGPLSYYHANEKSAPWKQLRFRDLGRNRTSGLRFDPQGNMYVGVASGKHKRLPACARKDSQISRSLGKIIKYSPTGSLKDGNLYPTVPQKEAKIYDVPFGAISGGFARTCFFGVDGFGRIYYPSSLLCRVYAMDNEGNEILRFGTYGNRDSMGGLKGDLVPTKDIPMAFPSSVDVTDDYIYVSDTVNVRLLRLAKTFAATETVGIK